MGNDRTGAHMGMHGRGRDERGLGRSSVVPQNALGEEQLAHPSWTRAGVSGRLFRWRVLSWTLALTALTAMSGGILLSCSGGSAESGAGAASKGMEGGVAGRADRAGESAGKGAGGRGGEKGGGKDMPPVPVDVAPPQPMAFEQSIALVGTLAADERVTVGTKVAGRLAEIRVDLGSAVRRGQPLARLEQTDYLLRVEQAFSAVNQARARLGLPLETDQTGEGGIAPVSDRVDAEETALVKEAKASLEQASLNLKRMEALADKNFVARSELEVARANFVKAESGLASAREEILNRQAVLQQRRAELRLARQQLVDTTVVSPLDGQVELRLANPGEMLSVGAPVATLVKLNPLRLRTEVSERDAPKVRVGQELQLQVEGEANPYVGKIARISPSITEQSRVLVIEAEVKNPGTLRPGSFVKGELVVSRDDPGLSIPTSAVVVFAGIEKAVVVEDGKAVEKRIETGRRTGSRVEVLSGLKPDDQVVRSPGNLQQGQAVVVGPAPSPEAGIDGKAGGGSAGRADAERGAQSDAVPAAASRKAIPSTPSDGAKPVN